MTEKAAATIKAFSNPPTRDSIRAADFFDNAGLCLECNDFYCYKHWNPSSSGCCTCPGDHGASLDPHRRPDYDFDP
ncbi:MAG: hypothetical protein HYX67_13295 [Candidatus Melainabacteria bacterium]|nr:hypothetical protein [Candidatus Melainabacteria bacterium]